VELDSVQIGAADVETAAAAYRLLLGLAPAPLDGGGRRFQLARGAIEIEAGEPGVRSIRFVGESRPGWPESFHWLPVHVGSRPDVRATTDGLQSTTSSCAHPTPIAPSASGATAWGSGSRSTGRSRSAGSACCSSGAPA